MKTLQEIKRAISFLTPQERTLLAAELFAGEPIPDECALEEALKRGLADVEAGRVQPLEQIKEYLPEWISGS